LPGVFSSRSESTQSKHAMMLKIACQQCGHIGLANAETLPRQLRCSRCGRSRRVEAKDSARIVNRVAFEEWLFGASGAPRAQSREHGS
jgi:hypothetical protein